MARIARDESAIKSRAADVLSKVCILERQKPRPGSGVIRRLSACYT